VGLIGVMIIVRPGGNVFNIGGFSMLVAAFSVGITSNIIRKLNQTDPAISITFYFTLSGAIMTSVACYFLEWITPNFKDLMLLVCVGLLGGVAQYALTLSFRYAAIGIIAPLKYLSIVIAGVLGYIIWGEAPDLITISGIAIIILCGLYSLYRERQLAMHSDIQEKLALLRR
jgi:drug/metabolite transporter (DMT)-like permease